MAEFTAKDVQALRQATGAGMMDAKKALAGERRRLRRRRQVAAREGPGQGGRARRPREHRGRGRRRRRPATSPPSSSSSARPTSSPSPTTSSRSSRSSPTPVAAEGEGAVDERKDRDRRPQGHAQGEHRARPGRPLRGGRRQRPRHLPAQPGRPRRQRRARRARRRRPGAGPRRRRAHRLQPSRSTSPATRCPGRRSPRSARRSSAITRAEGKPEAGAREDRRGPAQRLVQGPGAARAALRQGRQADDRPAARRRQRSSASPRSSIGG